MVEIVQFEPTYSLGDQFRSACLGEKWPMNNHTAAEDGTSDGRVLWIAFDPRGGHFLLDSAPTRVIIIHALAMELAKHA